MRRDEAVVANKLWWEFWPEQSAAAELDASLQRMGFDHVDLIYANPPPEGLGVADLVAAVGGLVAAGKARAWGIVNWPADLCGRGGRGGRRAGRSRRRARPAALQPGAAVMGGGPRDEAGAQSGRRRGHRLVLPGRRRAHRQVPVRAGGWPRRGNAREPRVALAVAAAEELAGLAGRLDTTAAALALAFPFTNPDVTSVLFGATSPQQLRANCAVIGLRDRLGPEQLAQLRRIGLPADTALR